MDTWPHFADHLIEAIDRKGTPICVGLDPVLEKLPLSLSGGVTPGKAEEAAHAIGSFCDKVLQIVARHVACVKFQMACFERFLWPGVRTYHRLVTEARSLGLVVIGDGKRGDIGASSRHYAAGCLADPRYIDLGPLAGADALTVNGYLGGDGLAPFINSAAAQGKGLFVLVRTSNPGGDAFQTLKLADGRRVCEAMADLVRQWGQTAPGDGSNGGGDEPALVGRHGYSLLGAVVGATKSAEIADLRRRMPEQIFLVPGFGAQGGSADDVRRCFNDDGRGAIITASRSIIFAYDKTQSRDWQGAIEEAVVNMKRQVADVFS
ncbi:MAG: orotidine-5'-phosphate decarboxylase [Phycisphaeraceae bacterium]|nr:orotidine-5'-phosphate decarboxylase [Phycisphaeraceae bacterium]